MNEETIGKTVAEISQAKQLKTLGMFAVVASAGIGIGYVIGKSTSSNDELDLREKEHLVEVGKQYLVMAQQYQNLASNDKKSTDYYIDESNHALIHANANLEQAGLDHLSARSSCSLF